MNRKEYWEKRQTQLFNAQDKQDAKLTERMRKEYERTAKAIDKDIASYYAKYAKDDVIEYRKLVVGLDKKEKDLLYQDVEKFVKKHPEHADLMPVRKSVYKLNRLEGLQLSTRQHLLELGAIEQAEYTKMMEDAYKRGYLSSMEGLENREAFFKVDDKVMQATLNQGWIDGKNFSDRIWDNKEKLINTLNNEIRDGLIRGDSYKKMIDIVENRTGVGVSSAKRLVFTESAYILNESNAQAFVDAGVKEYEISAVMDSKTSPTCRRMDGQQFKFSERVVGINAPIFHPYCRTTQIPVENDFKEIKMENPVYEMRRPRRNEYTDYNDYLEDREVFRNNRKLRDRWLDEESNRFYETRLASIAKPNENITKLESIGFKTQGLSELDPVALDSVVRGVDNVRNKYPDFIDKITKDGLKITNNSGTRSSALMSNDGIEIRINPDYYGNKNAYVKTLRDKLMDRTSLEENNWNAIADEFTHTITHELGHSFEDYANKKLGKTGTNLWNEISKEYNTKTQEGLPYISEYGKTDKNEWFAEMFSQVLTEKADSSSGKVLKIFKKLDNEV